MRRVRYFLTEEREVTEEEYVAAERRAGFFPKPGCGPVATESFGSRDCDKAISGRTAPDFHRKNG